MMLSLFSRVSPVKYFLQYANKEGLLFTPKGVVEFNGNAYLILSYLRYLDNKETTCLGIVEHRRF